MSFSSTGAGRFTVGVLDRYELPRVYPSARPPVVFMPGIDRTPRDGPGSAAHLIEALTAAGYRVVQPDVSYLLGNETADDRVDDAVDYARSLGATTDPPVLIGASNGAVCAMLYASDHDCSAVIGILSPIDVEALRDDDFLGLRAFYEAAWGVAYPDPLPSDAKPLSQETPLAAVPMQHWYATDDPCSDALPAFATATGAETHSLGAVGHAEAALAGVDEDVVVAFIRAHTAV